MNKIDKVRAEIERRQKKYQHSHDASNTTFPIYLELDNLLSFLDTLEEEPVCPDDGGAPSKQKCGDCTIACEAKVEEEPDKSLEEAADNFAHGYDHGTCDGIAQECFIAGAEWQEVDLEKEIDSYFKKWWMDLTDQGYILRTPDGTAGLISVKNIARHFYELGKNSK